MTSVERNGSVAVVRLAAGKVNALDLEVLAHLTGVLRDVGASDARAVVLTGEGRAFSAGVDLKAFLDGGAPYAAKLIPALSEVFLTLFSMPLPTVAAVNGAAIAGGCILACACDRRLLAEGAAIGATELSVGVPFPVAALEVVRAACGDRTDEVVLGAGLHQGADAVALGLAHEVVAADGLLDRAVAVAESLAAVPQAAFRLAKAQLRRPVLDRIAADAPGVDPGVTAVWAAPDTQAAVRASLERNVRR